MPGNRWSPDHRTPRERDSVEFWEVERECTIAVEKEDLEAKSVLNEVADMRD